MKALNATKKPTLQEMYFAVISDKILCHLFMIELNNRKFKSTVNATFINGKRVGVNKFINAKKYVAQFIYNGGRPEIPVEDPTQLTLEL